MTSGMISKFGKWLKPTKETTESKPCILDEIHLIEGTFSPIEAAEVLLSLINYKIKFHTVQLLNVTDKDELSLELSEKRIAELKKAKNRVTQLILEARDTGQPLRIRGIIQIFPKDS
ncbi:MAG: hypothetical protein AAF717_03970 [Bacteroidota bacterium]